MSMPRTGTLLYQSIKVLNSFYQLLLQLFRAENSICFLFRMDSSQVYDFHSMGGANPIPKVVALGPSNFKINCIGLSLMCKGFQMFRKVQVDFEALNIQNWTGC